MLSGLEHTLSGFRALDAPARAALLVISSIVALCAVFGCSYVVGQGYPALPLPLEALLALALVFVVASLLMHFDGWIMRLAARAKRGDEGRLARLLPAWRARSILLFSAIMALCWLPWLIANLPGSTYWDTYYQMYQVYPENHPISVIPWEEIARQTYTDAYLVDHHPVLTTLVYGAFALVSDALTGDWMAGVLCFTLLQGSAHIIVFTAAIAYLRRIGCPNAVALGAYLYFCLMPFVSTWALCMVKDSFFGVFFVLYFLSLAEVVRTQGDALSRRRLVAGLIACALMLCLTKKTGLFVVVPTAVVMAWSYRAHARAALAQGVVCLIVMCLVLPFLVFPAAQIAPGGAQEALGPFFQQTARVVKDHPDDVSPEEEAIIARVLDYDRLASEYRFDFEDSVKYRFDLDATPEDILAYLGVYAAQGLRHPDSYFGALMGLAGFYVAPCAYANIRMVTVDTKMGTPPRPMLWNPDELDGFRGLMDGAYRTIASVPVVDVPLLIVTYALWLPCICAYVALRRHVRMAVLFVPYLVLLGFCIIAPVYDARYAVPIFDAAPLLFALLVTMLPATGIAVAPARVAYEENVPQDGHAEKL